MIRKLAPASINQARELHAGGAAEIKNFIERRAQRAAGMNHIIDEQNMATLDGEINFSRFLLWVQADAGKVIAMQCHGECAERVRCAQKFVQPRRHPRTAGKNAKNSMSTKRRASGFIASALSM